MTKICDQCGKEKGASTFIRGSTVCQWCIRHPYAHPRQDDGVFEELPYDSLISYENIKKRFLEENPDATAKEAQTHYLANYSFGGKLHPTEYSIDNDGNMQPNRWGPWRVIKPGEKHIFEDDRSVTIIQKHNETHPSNQR